MKIKDCIDACAQWGDNVIDAVDELKQFEDGVNHGWNPLMREIAKLSDAMGLDEGDWQEAGDDILLEQFDPWTAIRIATERAKLLSAIVESWSAYQVTMDSTLLDNKKHWTAFLEAMRAAEQAFAVESSEDNQ